MNVKHMYTHSPLIEALRTGDFTDAERILHTGYLIDTYPPLDCSAAVFLQKLPIWQC